MGWLIKRLCAFLALAGAALAAPASAETLPADCVLSRSSAASLEAARADRSWDCSDNHRIDSAPYIWLKFERSGSDRYRHFAMEARPFGDITIYAIGEDGRVHSDRISSDTVSLSGFNDVVGAIPEGQGATGPVYVRIDGYVNYRDPPHVALLETPDQSVRPVNELIFPALLSGLVFAPCVIGIMLAIGLRQSFVAWYAVMCLGMVVTIGMTSGLIVSWTAMALSTFLAFERIGFTLIVFGSCLFARSFIEREALSPLSRAALLWAGIAILGVGAFNAFVVPSPALFGATMLVVLASLVGAIIQAVRRNSRWVRYQIVGWSAPMVLAADMAIKGLGQGGFLNSDMSIVYYAMVWEIAIGAIGVTDRVMLLRADRDRARERALEMEGLAERDPLTGLMNRRAIHKHFEELQADGFTACALLDLDHFKSINDQFGHVVGDDVLTAVGRALAPDEDTLAIRMGGEEFMLLLRGPNAHQRAERRRAAISVRIAREVASLDRIVTASQGVVEFDDAAAQSSTLEAYYMRADNLLYRAKKEGRNRTVAERVGMHESELPIAQDAA